MEEKQTKKSKKSKTKKELKQKFEKPITKIEDEMDKIIFPSFYTNDNNVQQYIIDGVSNPVFGAFYSFTNKYIPFMYSDLFHCDPGVPAEIKSYVNELIRKIKFALGIHKKLKLIDDIIETIDAPSLEIQQNNPFWKNQIPRYKKYKRLEKMYDVLIQFTLKLIHTFYWFDFGYFGRINNVGEYTHEDKSANVFSLNEYVNNLLPLILKLKDELEKEVDKEYPVDILEAGTGLY